jgi:hypothetical protein
LFIDSNVLSFADDHERKGEAMRIAVAGGTGQVGRVVVERARAAGHDSW